MPSRHGLVVLERDGGLWGVAGDAVRRLSRRGASLAVEVDGGEIAADRVLAVVPGLPVVPAPAALSRFWPEAAAGLAIYAARPVLVIDPRRPPSALLARAADDEGGGGNGT